MRNILKAYDSGLNYIVFSGEESPGCGVPKDSEEGKEIAAYLAEHPEAVQPEPLPPPPTDAQLEAQAEAQRQALFIDYDHAVSKCRRHIEEGDTSRDWPAMLAAWNAYGMALEALNDEPGWFRVTVWPTKPEI